MSPMDYAAIAVAVPLAVLGFMIVASWFLEFITRKSFKPHHSGGILLTGES